MENLKIFEKEGFGSIRIQVENGEPMFCLSDVCKALGLTNTSSVAMRIDKEDRSKLDLARDNQVVNGNSIAIFVTEMGLYDVILFSDSPKVKPFKRWITKEVLPSIRKTGGYIIDKPEDTNEDILARAFIVAMDTIKRKDEKIKELDSKIEEQVPKVEFFDQVTDSTDAVDMAVCAKTLNMGIGRNHLFEILRSEKILQPNNQPYQRYIDNGWFRVIEQKFEKADGSICIYFKTVVYQKGMDGIRKVLNRITKEQ